MSDENSKFIETEKGFEFVEKDEKEAKVVDRFILNEGPEGVKTETSGKVFSYVDDNGDTVFTTKEQEDKVVSSADVATHLASHSGQKKEFSRFIEDNGEFSFIVEDDETVPTESVQGDTSNIVPDEETTTEDSDDLADKVIIDEENGTITPKPFTEQETTPQVNELTYTQQPEETLSTDTEQFTKTNTQSSINPFQAIAYGFKQTFSNASTWLSMSAVYMLGILVLTIMTLSTLFSVEMLDDAVTALSTPQWISLGLATTLATIFSLVFSVVLTQASVQDNEKSLHGNKQGFKETWKTAPWAAGVTAYVAVGLISLGVAMMSMALILGSLMIESVFLVCVVALLTLVAFLFLMPFVTLFPYYRIAGFSFSDLKNDLKNNYWEAFGSVLLIGVLVSMFASVPYIGVLFAFIFVPVGMLSYGHVMRQLRGLETAEA